MRAVHVFACRCGTRYKAITEINRDELLRAQKRTPFMCPACQDRIEVDGRILSVESAVQPEIWRRVDLQSLD